MDSDAGADPVEEADAVGHEDEGEHVACGMAALVVTDNRYSLAMAYMMVPSRD